jgi:cytochrome P450
MWRGAALSVAAAAALVAALVAARRVRERRGAQPRLPRAPEAAPPRAAWRLPRTLSPWWWWQGDAAALAREGSRAFAARLLREATAQAGGLAPSLVRTRVMRQEVVYVFSAECLRAVERLERDGLVGPGRKHSVTELLGHHSLVCLDGKVHRLRRQQVTRVLSGAALARNLAAMEALVEERLLAVAAPPGAPFDVSALVHRLVWDMMWGVLVGADSPLVGTRCDEAFTHIKTFARGLSAAPASSTYRAAQASRDWLHAAFREVLRAGGGGSLLRELSASVDEEGSVASDVAIAENATVILFAAVDTTTSLLLNMLRQLIANPDAMDKATREVLAFFARRPAGAGALGPDELAQLVFLDACVKETMAHDGPFASLYRVAKEDLELDGYHVDKGTVLDFAMSSILAGSLGADRSFRPERWTDPAAAAVLESNGYRPWGVSTHRCPGFLFPPAESKLLFVKLVSRYRLGVHELPTEWQHRPALLPKAGRFLVSLKEI